ncbi:MAG: hypothetical protein ACRENB_05385 [Gemmatimonadales bacterium]
MPADPFPIALGFVPAGAEAVEVPVTVDWTPAVEWTRLQEIRRGADPVQVLESPWRATPEWEGERETRRLRAVRIAVEVPGTSRALETVIPVASLGDHARAALAGLVKTGRVAPGQEVPWYAVTRERPAETPGDGGRARFRTRAVAPEIRLRTRGLAAALEATVPEGSHHADDVPVLLPAAVLGEVRELTLSRPGAETGGVLIGHLCRDERSPELLVEVTAQIPAREAVGDAGKLSFTAQVWADLRAALGLRGRGEIMLGWWHSHPVREWCRNCTEDKRATCALAEGFLSDADRRLHRAVFPRAYSIALVASDAGRAEPGLALFGWRAGLLERRGFHRMAEDVRDVA